jgi:hypothetical protein
MDHIRIFVKYITSILCSTIDYPSVIVDSFNFDNNDNHYNILGVI